MNSNLPVPALTSSPRVVVVGGGIAGAEAALTLAIGLPGATVTLVSAAASISILPNLIYLPFGVAPDRADVDLAELLPHGVHSVVAHVQRVDVGRRLIETTAGAIEFDVLIVAPGAVAAGQSDRVFCSADDALRVRDQLSDIVARAAAGEHLSIVIRAEAEDSWTAPACELGVLVGAWLRAHKLDRNVETVVATADREVFEWFGPAGSDIVDGALRRSRVQVATAVPAGRFDELGGDMVVEFGRMQARTIPGLPGLGASGWYEPSHDFAVAPNVFVIGDAINLPYRAGFATAWQSRRVMRALGGDLRRLGANLDGIPVQSVEYQMDLADAMLTARIPVAGGPLQHPFLGHEAEVDVVAGARPDKLAGLVLHDRVIRWRATAHDAPLAYRDVIRSAATA